jgi:hypothetical protein
VDLYIHSPIRLHGVMKHRDNFAFFIYKVVLSSLFTHCSFRKLFVCIRASVKIMEMEKYEVRVLLRRYWKKNL